MPSKIETNSFLPSPSPTHPHPPSFDIEVGKTRFREVLILIILLVSADRRGKENQSYANSTKNNKRDPNNKAQKISTPVKRPPIEHGSAEKHLDSQKLQVHTKNANFS